MTQLQIINFKCEAPVRNGRSFFISLYMKIGVIERMKEFLEQYEETLMRIKYAIAKEDDKRTEESRSDDRDSVTEDK